MIKYSPFIGIGASQVKRTLVLVPPEPELNTLLFFVIQYNTLAYDHVETVVPQSYRWAVRSVITYSTSSTQDPYGSPFLLARSESSEAWWDDRIVGVNARTCRGTAIVEGVATVPVQVCVVCA